jgi:hypothetical protein
VPFRELPWYRSFDPSEYRFAFLNIWG